MLERWLQGYHVKITFGLLPIQFSRFYKNEFDETRCKLDSAAYRPLFGLKPTLPFKTQYGGISVCVCCFVLLNQHLKIVTVPVFHSKNPYMATFFKSFLL